MIQGKNLMRCQEMLAVISKILCNSCEVLFGKGKGHKKIVGCNKRVRSELPVFVMSYTML